MKKGQQIPIKKFSVEVCRVSFAFHTIEVEAKTKKEAEQKAYDEAGDYEYYERSAEYEVVSVK